MRVPKEKAKAIERALMKLPPARRRRLLRLSYYRRMRGTIRA
jgi:hypothetical protein